jgi:uncharacterized membrane protein (UPF0182 family)
VLLGLVAAFIVVIVLGRALARFYLDALWFDAVEQSGTFWTMLRAKVTLFALFFTTFALLAGINLVVADRLAPSRFPGNVHPYVERLHDVVGRRLRLYRYLIAGIAALAMALPTTAEWQSWLLYRNRQRFGEGGDAQFGVDVGFYVFELPFLSFVLDWLFLAVVVVGVFTIVTHVLNGSVVFASPIPSVSQAMKGHLAFLAALLCALKAADYWVRRYETTNDRRGVVQGPTYAVVHATLPALVLLIVVALVVAGLFLSVLRTQSFRIPLVASAVWIVLAILAGYVYPAMVQALVVEPNQEDREAESIANNIEATRQAMGISANDVTAINVEFAPLTSADVRGTAESGADPLQDIRLLNPQQARSQFVAYGGSQAGLTIDDLDVDRDDLDGTGEVEQILIGARELDLAGAGNTSWQGQHLIYTHGCGLMVAPASRVLSNGRPDFRSVELDHDELYFSPGIDGWAVANTDANEQGCPGTERYEGTAGIEMSSWFRRAAFALSFMDYNLLGSGSIDDESQMLWVRNVPDRVAKLAPFLTFDGDPYPVEVDGRALWVLDAYTSTSRYPSAQAVGNSVVLSEGSGIPRDANYIRNSVKAVVDAYDGTVHFYVVDEGDPLVQAWWSAFPDLFTGRDEMPAGLAEHLRYPEDLFRVQADLYSKYQLSPEAFFGREGAWSVAQAPPSTPRDVGTVVDLAAPATAAQANEQEFATESSSARFVPYYTMFDADATSTDPGGRQFVMLIPFVPFTSDDADTKLQAFMTASTDDPNDAGRLTVYVVQPTPLLPDGPRGIVAAIESDDEIARLVSELNRAGSGANVEFGDLQLVRVGEGLLWARPFYVSVRQSDGGASLKVYRFMVVVANGQAAYSTTIGGAVSVLFPSLEGYDVGELISTDEPLDDPALETVDVPETSTGEPSADGSEPPVSSLPDDATATEVLERVESLLADAEAELDGDAPDLGRYQQLVAEASALLEQFLTPPATTEPATPSTTDD